MSETTEIKCDECGTDLTYTGNCADYYLVVSSAGKSPWYLREGLDGGVLTAMAAYPPVNRTHHFCDLKCMDGWRDKAREVARKREEWRKANRVEVSPGFFTAPPYPTDAS